jgi:alpha-amylase
MKKICFYFQVHQPYRLKNYHFFDIGNSSEYFDDVKNNSVMKKVAEKCYLPMNSLLLDLINEHGGKFKISFSISGTALDQFAQYAPEVLQSFKKLAATGCVEFLGETYSHSLSSLVSPEEFSQQVREHSKMIEQLFGQKPTVFRNTELVYSDKIGLMVNDMGFKAMLAEGANHVLGWKSPNFLYCSSVRPELKLLLKNYRLSDDIAFRFSQRSWNGWPLTTEKYVGWLNALPANEEIVNLFMDYETFGEHQWKETGIFDFMRALPGKIFSSSQFGFVTPSEAVEQLQPVASISMPDSVSWADEERNLSAWLGNDIQDNAFEAIYGLEKRVKATKNPELLKEWRYLQTSDHFYYMCTKFFADGDVHKYFNPYNSPYEAFINYMNVFSDFEARVNAFPLVTELQRITLPKVAKPNVKPFSKQPSRRNRGISGKGLPIPLPAHPLTSN